MLEIYACFSRAKHKSAIFSKLLQLWMGASFSHSYFRIVDKELSMVYVYEAKSGGVHLRSIETFDSVNDTVEMIKMPKLCPLIEKEFKRDLIQWSGIHYGYKQNIGIAIADIVNNLGFKMTRNLFNDGMNCSEVVARLIEKHWSLKFKERYDLIDPKDLRNELKEWLKLE